MGMSVDDRRMMFTAMAFIAVAQNDNTTLPIARSERVRKLAKMLEEFCGDEQGPEPMPAEEMHG